MKASGQTKVWIDMDNSPHVPFFAPIVDVLERRGYSVVLTARDCFQVCELADLLKLRYAKIGRHYGKNAVLKMGGLGYRALQLARFVLAEKPDLALSHGSRSQLLLAGVLGIPSLTICDYEFTRVWALMHPTWAMIPEIIPESAIKIEPQWILKYPGIKEDVYVPRFRSDTGIKALLGLAEDDIVVTLRPPADQAHYHNPQSDELFHAVVDFLGRKPNVRIVLLPRGENQVVFARRRWPALFDKETLLIPPRVVDGLNLIWHSDLVISGGGTMNREAAALGVPVYSIFRGKVGAVDRYLAKSNRLVLLESVEDIERKLVLVRRDRPAKPENVNGSTLETIVDNIVSVMESQCKA